MLLRDEVVIFGVAFLIIIMYLFYVRYPLNRETDSDKRTRAERARR
jgi:hypothetical protein